MVFEISVRTEYNSMLLNLHGACPPRTASAAVKGHKRRQSTTLASSCTVLCALINLVWDGGSCVVRVYSYQ